jgi:hypothetical protein
MKITAPVTPLRTSLYLSKQKNEEQNKALKETNTRATLPIRAYRDFNISFSGRTPENFYAQDFNRDNMPTTMKRFLDYDYAQRQHIPPEQMMHEVFKHLETAKDFTEVKKLYPSEELFSDLHPNKKNTRTNVLSEIKIARELSSTPLLKDGSDDFGMYLLRKIYSEGKTLKEISKDFLENDINDEYKGFITKPIDYATTSAYGIKFPNNAFWHSFISTREEYKKFFVTLPKNMFDPNRTSGESHSSSHSTSRTSSTQEVESKPRPRKHKIQEFRKKQITNDIKESNGDMQVMEKKIRKRFSKDDPEASFIVKYWSPIMTVASDKIHLSEELKYFNENEKTYGKTSDEKYMLTRFWKANPMLLEDFSKAVPDTIEMFEETYGGGGLVPINNEFEKVTDKTENPKIIDFVSPEFLELLDYTKEIEPKRTARYKEHDELQKKWEEHFLTRYGEVQPEAPGEEAEAVEEIPPTKTTTQDDNELINEVAKDYNTDVHELNGTNGNTIKLVGNLEEFLHDLLVADSKIFPTKFANFYIRELSKSPDFDERLKLSIATLGIRDKIDDERIMNADDVESSVLLAKYHFYYENVNRSLAATCAMVDGINKYLRPEISNVRKLYNMMPDEFVALDKAGETRPISNLLSKERDLINSRYEYYTAPLGSSEINKIGLVITDSILKLNDDSRLRNKDTVLLAKTIREAIETSKYKKKFLRDVVLPHWIKNHSFSKILLDKNDSPEVKRAKFELVLNFFTRDIIDGGLLALAGSSLINKYFNSYSPELQDKIAKIEQSLTPEEIVYYKDTDFIKLDKALRK